jgi:lambda repressor-like predicted transcriptional regulator
MSEQFLETPSRRRTRSEVSALYESFVQSGLSLREYSRLHGVAKSSLSAVVNRRRRAAQQVVPAQPSFVPVEIVAAQKHEPRSSAPLVLEFSNGLRIAVERDFDEPTLRRLVAVLA